MSTQHSDIRPHATLALFDHLDALSRHRALTDSESEMLEHAQNLLIHGPRTHGLNIELARRGLLHNRRRRSQP